MHTKEQLLEKLDGVVQGLNELEGDPNKAASAKAALIDLTKKASTNFGRASDNLPAFAEVKKLPVEVKAIQRKAFTTAEDFMLALHAIRDSALQVIVNLRDELADLDDSNFKPDKNVGNTGTRTLTKTAVKNLETGETEYLTTKDVVEIFFGSSFLDKAVEVEMKLAHAIREALKEKGYEVIEEKERSSDNFYSMYRMARPSNIKKIAEMRTERGIKPGTVAEREQALKERATTEKAEAKKRAAEAKAKSANTSTEAVEEGPTN